MNRRIVEIGILLSWLTAITLSHAKNPEDNKDRFDVGAALNGYIVDDDWSAFEEHVDQLVKKRRLDPVRDSLRARFVTVVRPALLEKILADYDNGLGMVLFDSNHYREALACFERAQRACSLYDNPDASQANLVNRTLCHALLGDTSASLFLFRQMIDPMIRDRTIYNQIYGDPEGFIRDFYGTDRIRHLADSLIRTDTVLAAGWYYLLGYVQYREDEYTAAQSALGLARTLFERTADPDGLFYTELYMAENASAADSASEANNLRFLTIVLKMLRCDSTAETAEVLSSWNKNFFGDPLEVRFDSLVLATFDRHAATEPDRAILRGRLQFIIGSNPEFALEPAAQIDLFRGYLASPRTRADTLRPIMAQWNLMELYAQTEQPDSAREYFQAVWRVMRRMGETRSLSDLVAIIQGIPDPFQFMTMPDRALAVLIDNVLRGESDTLAEPSIDSLRAAYRQVLTTAAKTDIAWVNRLMSDFYRSQFLTEPDSAEFYFWKAYAVRRDLGDTLGVQDCIEQLSWSDGYDPLPYLDGLARDLAGLAPYRLAIMKIHVADHLDRVAHDSYANAGGLLGLLTLGLPDPSDPRTAQITYYQDLISYLTGGDQPLPDTSGHWTVVADDPAITRPIVDTITAYLSDLAMYSNDQGTDQQVSNYADELRASAYLAWAGRLTARAQLNYRESAQALENILAQSDPATKPAQYFGVFRDLARSRIELRDNDALLRSYDAVYARLASHIYRDIPRYDREEVRGYVAEAYQGRDSLMAGLVKLDLVDFAGRVIEWGGGGYGAGMGIGEEIPDRFAEYEKKMLKPEAIYVEGKDIVKYIKPVTFQYIETRPPGWRADRLVMMTRIIGRFYPACRADAGLTQRWELLPALIFLSCDDIPAADSVLRGMAEPDTADPWLFCAHGLARGTLLRLTGDLAAADSVLNQARNRSVALDRADLLSACLSGEAGNVRFTIGDLVEADADYAHASAIADEHPVWPLLNARLRLTAGNIRLIMGLTTGDPASIDTAIAQYGQTLAWMGNNLELETYCTVRLNLAIANWVLGRSDTAKTLLEDLIGEAASDKMLLEEAWARSVLGYFYIKSERLMDAAAVLDPAVIIFRDLGDRYGLSNCLLLLGAARRRLGQTGAAYHALKESIELYETIRTGLSRPDAVRAFCRRNEDRYAEMVQLLLSQDSVSSALEYLERSKSAKLKEVFSDLALETGDPRLDEKLSKLRGIAGDIEQFESRLVAENSRPEEQKDRTAVDRLGKVLAQNRAELEELLVDLELSNPEIYSLLAIKPQLFAEDRIRQSIPKDAVFLEYFPADTALYIFLFTRETLTVHAVPASRNRIDSLVVALRSLIAECAQSVAAGFGVNPIDGWQDDGSKHYRDDIKPMKDLLADLYGCLISPVEKEIGSAGVAVIVPSGSLYYLPFHALGHEENGRFTFLLEKIKISYLSTSTMMDALNHRAAKFDNLLAFGDPDGSLKGAREEVEAIAKIVPHSEILTLGEAMESRVKTRPDSFSVLHLATHAILNNVNPKSSYIVFAPDTAQGEDGKLGFGEILRIPLKKRTTLVTLSACQTAVGKNPTGSEMINLSRAFISAGVPSILSTLWPVEDLSTRNLMISFYQNLVRENKVESLRDAQLKLLKSSATAHPFFWAPFVLIGDWQ